MPKEKIGSKPTRKVHAGKTIAKSCYILKMSQLIAIINSCQPDVCQPVVKANIIIFVFPSNRTSNDIPNIKMSQCGAYDSIDYKGSRPMDEPYIIVDNNAPSTSSTVTGKEDNLYESTR